MKIVFDGYISGEAKKYFIKRSKMLGVKMILFSLLLILPAIVCCSLYFKSLTILWIYLLLLIVFPTIGFLVSFLQYKDDVIPKKIILDIDEETICCIADNYIENKFIYDVKKVTDHGEFYEVIFPFGNVSDKFICQKSLLTEGDLDTFESLFGDILY